MTQITKQVIADSFVKLVEEKSIDSITILCRWWHYGTWRKCLEHGFLWLLRRILSHLETSDEGKTSFKSI